MILLPNNITNYQNFNLKCNEKIESYLQLAKLNIPILKSVIITNNEIENMTEEIENIIKSHLKCEKCMIRYIYINPCHSPRNGGKIVDIKKENISQEAIPEAHLWLLEECDRTNNLWCSNISINLNTNNIHIEILGEGFDISDINKGKIIPHEYIDLSYPIEYGEYKEWWKWASFSFCSQNEYINSIKIRKKRLNEFKVECINFNKSYKPLDLGFIEIIISTIEKIYDFIENKNIDFCNLSCSYEKNKKFICWDIQTPKGKLRAYLDN